jgi:ABC-type Mn2+/Zn2+ transport system permease subunit
MNVAALERFFVEPLASGFFVRGLAAAVLVMIGGAALGFGVLTRRYAYLGQGVSQSMLAGIAVGATVGAGATISAFAAAVVAAALISLLGRVRGLGPDAAVAVVASAAMSVGVAIISADRTRAVNLNNLLFGNVLGVTWNEVVILSVAVVAASTFTFTQGRRLALASIAPSVALAHGVNVRRIEMYRLVTLALVTAAAVQIVGVTLVVAALVLPAATAAVFTRTLGTAHTAAVACGVVVAVAGLYLSYWRDLASGPSVVIAGTVLYAASLLVSSFRQSR